MGGPLILYVTSHGYGHATRAAALAAALRRLAPERELEIRTDAPEWIFREACPDVRLTRGGADAGFRQSDALTVDLEASLAAHRALLERWPSLVESEAAYLRERGAELVVGDVPPLAFAAAHEADVPSIAVSNFTWDWILEPVARRDERWRAPQKLFAQAYGRAAEAIRLPLHGDFPAFAKVVDAPLLCRLAEPGAGEALRARLGLGGDRRPLVLAAFGGFGVDVPALAAGEDLSSLVFAGFGPKPEGLRADWHELRAGTSADQLAAMAACDVLLGKPGYGAISEALAFGRRMVYVPRDDYPENAPLVAGIEGRGSCAALPPEDFRAGRWRAALERALAAPPPAPVPADGDEWIARRLLSLGARLGMVKRSSRAPRGELLESDPMSAAVSDRLRRRSSGVLLHVTSLPGGHGIGDLGPAARAFADWLAEAGQTWWQMLPINPAGAADSPYSSPSSFAGNPWLLSLEDLRDDGLLAAADLEGAPRFPDGRVDYEQVKEFKEPRLRKAFAAFSRDGSGELWSAFRAFCRDHQDWVEDYATYCALKRHYEGRSWTEWPPEVRERRFREWPRQLLQAVGEETAYRQFLQFLFARQWARLRKHAASRGIGLIGDVPIFVAHESADVWAHQEVFQLGPDGRPVVVAGVPPDYFSEDGQLWGNPHYRWDRLKETGYAWWVARLRAAAERFDAVRLDHFIGFQRYWEIPADAKTAKTGKWVPGPGADFFAEVRKQLPQLELIAEDLGSVTPEVMALRDKFDFPGMRVLQFAFGSDQQAESFLPHNYPRRTVAYTGTHDNDTTRGWYEGSSTEKERHNARVYLGSDGKDMAWDMIRGVMKSTADTVVIPAQDLLSLPTESRMNKPGTVKGNWTWRLLEGRLDSGAAKRLKDVAREAGRIGGIHGG